MARALQVLIEPRERPIRLVAQKAFESGPIPRAIGRPDRFRRRWFAPTRGPGEQSRGIRDVVLYVCADDKPIQLFARHARGTAARLEVKCECRGRDEGLVTAAAGTAQVGGLMDFGTHVVTEVALALEMTIAFPTVMVNAAVCVVLLQRVVARKVAITVIAWPVGIGIGFVLLEGAVVWEPSFAADTIGH